MQPSSIETILKVFSAFKAKVKFSVEMNETELKLLNPTPTPN